MSIPPSHTPKQKHSLPQRLFKRFFAGDAKDVIVADVGAHGHNVVVGKNIIQIGNLVIPQRLMILLVTLLLILLLWMISRAIFQRLPASTMPSDSFNIAVIDWTITNTNQQQVTDQAVLKAVQNLVSRVTEYLSSDQATIATSFPGTVEIWGPAQLRTIAVNSEEEAFQFADKVRAHILVYGEVVVERPTVWRVTPRFYVHQRNAQLWQHAQELAGPYALGAPLELSTDNELGNSAVVISALNERLSALLPLALAVSYIFQEPPNYSAAIRTLEDLLDQSGWPSSYGEGQEILYHFLGNAYLGKSRETSDRVQQRSLLEKSMSAYEQAIVLDKNYPRPHNSLGTVYTNLALLEDRCSPSSHSLFNRSKEHYEQAIAIDAVRKPLHAYVDDFAHAGIGAVEMALGNCAIGGYDTTVAQAHYDKAVTHFQDVVRTYHSQSQPTTVQTNLAIYAHTRMGQIALNIAFYIQNVDWQRSLQNAKQEFAQTFALIHQTPTKQNVNSALEIAHQYLAVLCYLDEGATAQSFLQQLLTDAQQVAPTFNSIEMQVQILAELSSYSIEWEECIHGTH